MRFCFLLIACACACQPSSTRERPPVREPERAEPRDVAPNAPAAIVARHVDVSWGSIGPVPPEGPPLYVAGVAELELPAPQSRLELRQVELFDDRSAHVATGRTELVLRRADPGRARNDYSQYGTEPIPTPVPAGVLRILFSARLDRNADELTNDPVRYRATLRAGDGRMIVIEGPLDPQWPTA